MDKTGIFIFCEGLIEEMNMNDGQRLSQGLHVVSDTRNICSNIMVCHHFELFVLLHVSFSPFLLLYPLPFILLPLPKFSPPSLPSPPPSVRLELNSEHP